MSLEVEGVVSGYTREVPILKGIDLIARDGLVTVIIGPNGAGKSTLLRTIYGYLHPSAGDVRHDGQVDQGPGARARCSAKASPTCSRATACSPG